MTTLSGINLAVAGIPTVSAWVIHVNDQAVPIVASNTNEAVNRICGVLDWKGVIASYGHTPAYLPKDSITFVGSLDGSVGVSGPCMVTDVAVTADYDADSRYMTFYTIHAQGALTFGAAAASDTTEPTIVCPAGNPVYINNVALTDVARWELRVFVTPVGYVASDTGGVRKKLAGPFDAELTIERYINTESPPEPGDVCSVELVVEPAQGNTPRKSWLASAMRVLSIEEYGANMDLLKQGRRPKHTITMGLAYAGSITTPGGVQVWP